jgi:cytochrome c6
MIQRAGLILLVLIVGHFATPAEASNLVRGRELYMRHCAVCHGINGVPVIQQAPNFAAKERLMQPDMMLMMSVRMGKNTMPPFMGILRDDEIVDILQYARTLR